MANRDNRSYDGQDGYSGGSYGYYDENGYYDEPYAQSGSSGGQNGSFGDSCDPYGSRSAGEPDNGRVSMAAKASGQTNAAGSRADSVRRQTQQRAQQYYSASRRRRKRRRRHRGRRFLIFLLIFVIVVLAAYFALFRAPSQVSDGLHTRNSDIYNLLICATDKEEMRTDTMMIATLNQSDHSVALTSLPRDSIVSTGEAVPKLNGVYALYGGGEAGAEALMDQVELLLGFRPDGYVVIDYDIFKDTVDAMGGVTFDVPMDMVVDNANDPDDILYISAGEQVLDGTMALGVCRYRYGYAMADIQRQYVQQSFLKAMLEQLLTPRNILKLPAVSRAALNNLSSDLSNANLRYLAVYMLLAARNDIEQNTLPGEGVDYNGASCYGLYGQSVVDMVNEVMNPYEEEITLDDVYILTVSGGYLVESTWRGVAFDASSYEY